MNERQHKIIDLLSKYGKTSVGKLSELMQVSGVTIRQDLTKLEKEGLLKRVHGGAVLHDAEDISLRLVFNYKVKQRIAREAARFIGDGETVLLESGSINALLARELKDKKDLTVITTNLFVAQELRKNRQIKIIIPGGIVQHDSQSLVGDITKKFLSSINFKKAFIGIDGFTGEAGFTSRDLMRAEISNFIVEKSKEVFIVSDSSKFGRTELVQICRTEAVSNLITDGALDKAYRSALMAKGVDVVICE